MATKRVGSLIYSTNQGLGVLARAFYEHDVFNSPYVVVHPHHVNHVTERYGSTTPMVGARDFGQPQQRRDLERWVKSLDLLLCFETPFDWYLVNYARTVGVPTALVTMHECTPARFPDRFDHLLCPSLLDLEAFTNGAQKYLAPMEEQHRLLGFGGEHTDVWFTPVPVDTGLVPYRRRGKLETLVHNAGWGGLKGRNGTREFLHALDLMEKRPGVILRTQKREADIETMVDYLRLKDKAWDIRHVVGTTPYEELFTTGDVFVFPEKFNGLSLPLQEAFAAGMFVVSTERFPNTTYLPAAGLVLPDSFHLTRIGPAYREFNEAVVNPRDLAEKLDEVVGTEMPAEYATAAAEYRETMSWDNLGDRWTEFVASLCK